MKHQFIAALFLLLAAPQMASTQTNWIKPLIAVDLFKGYKLHDRSSLSENQPAYSNQYITVPSIGIAWGRKDSEGRTRQFTLLYTQQDKDYNQGINLDSMPVFFESLGSDKSKHIQLMYDWKIRLGARGHSAGIFPYPGIFLRSRTSFYDFQPTVSSFYPVHNWKSGVEMGFSPGFELRFKPNMALDLGASIGLLDLGVEGAKYENPVLSAEQQKTTNFYTDFTINTQLRLGLAFMLGQAATN